MARGVLDGAARRRALDAMASGDLDLLIVGGGITGTGAALDAATRGLRAGLVEARDLAAGTSSTSSKLIHGGLRYLEMGDIALVREALRERELLLTRLAPHLVAPVPFLWPLKGRGWERAYLGAGLVLYDSLGGARSVPRHRHLSRRGALAVAPALRRDALVGAVQFHDAAEDDARMVAVVARTAAAHGAHIATRVRVTGFRRPGEVEAVDEETGERVTLRARHVAGAAGAWTDRLRELAGGRSAHRIVASKGIHVFVPGARIPMETGILARTEKSVLFIIPWQGGWLIGDTDTAWRHGPDQPVATRADVDYLLAKTNALLADPLRREDVHGVTAGLRPLVTAAARSNTTRISRRHVVERPAPGLTTIAGGKYTTYRVMAADLVDAVAGVLGERARSLTRDVPLHAGRAQELAGLIEARPELAEPLEGGGGHLRAEVVHACTHEGALHLDDVLERRTRLALTAPDRGLEAARARRRADGRCARLGRRPHAGRGGGLARAGRGGPGSRGRAGRRTRARRLPRGARRAPGRAGAAVTALVLGLDQGTSSTRCVALDAELRELGVASVPVASSFPLPGLVEQDPEAIADSAERAISGALAAAGAGAGDVAALGIANQTETFVVWDRATGRAVHPAIVWQDRRTDAACAEHRAGGHEDLVRERTGLELDATFPATKLRWLLDHVDGARAAAEDGRLAYGDVASWLLHRLAGIHVTDAGNAGRSLLCPLGGLDWDDELLELFGVPRALLPPIVDSDAVGVDGRRAPRPSRRRRPAGVALRPALLRAGDGEGHARHGRVPLGPGGVDATETAGRHPRVVRVAARRDHQLRARGLHPDGGRGRRLVRTHRRAPGGARARRAAGRGR